MRREKGITEREKGAREKDMMERKGEGREMRGREIQVGVRGEKRREMRKK